MKVGQVVVNDSFDDTCTEATECETLLRVSGRLSEEFKREYGAGRAAAQLSTLLLLAVSSTALCLSPFGAPGWWDVARDIAIVMMLFAALGVGSSCCVVACAAEVRNKLNRLPLRANVLRVCVFYLLIAASVGLTFMAALGASVGGYDPVEGDFKATWEASAISHPAAVCRLQKQLKCSGFDVACTDVAPTPAPGTEPPSLCLPCRYNATCCTPDSSMNPKPCPWGFDPCCECAEYSCLCTATHGGSAAASSSAAPQAGCPAQCGYYASMSCNSRIYAVVPIASLGILAMNILCFLTAHMSFTLLKSEKHGLFFDVPLSSFDDREPR
ncbi:hypothetical protein DIPPA_02396 [Diplonema papillatum]|nr:hypothetical protein DIPPA_02396 [Diplonema papillatum]|eukprot:gene9711-15081_t